MVLVRRRGVHPVEAVAVVGGAALLAGSWVVVAAGKDVPAWEADLFRGINDLPDVLWPIVRVPMQLGSLVGSLVVVAGTAIITRNKRLTLAALVGSQAAYWGAKAVKQAVSRARPGELLHGVQLREHAGGLGYLSGHTAIAFALAAVLGPEMPRTWQKIGLGVLAAIVGFARIYAGAHLPLDVIGGAGLGLVCGTLSRWAFGLGGEGLPPRPS
jgi:membrane-associated phospholipid phosphatase